MGCSSSKRIEATVDVYRPAPASFAVFDINTIEEPWLKVDHAPEHHQEKPTHLPPLILEKLNALEEGPRSWDEVSRALEDLKPTLHSPAPAPQATRKSLSFHTVAELDTKLSSKPTESTRTELKKTESIRINSKKPESRDAAAAKRGVGRQGCEGCGGARFVPCLECGGSCKVMVGETKERCSECNENGLVQCPAYFYYTIIKY
ncbi:unnamed protein product, partial [Vitis vinifera]